MIPISELFIDPDEQLIEDLTIHCFYKYGDCFLESIIPFFESGIMTEMEEYFDKEYNALFEVEEFDDEDKREVRKNVKDSIKSGRKASESLTGKRRGIRKITNQLSKSKIGRAVVKGVRRVAYGTKLGRKVVRKYADVVDKMASPEMTKAGQHGKESLRAALRAKGISKNTTLGNLGNLGAAMSYNMASDAHGRNAGVYAHQASKKLRQAHQLRRNADFIEKKQKAKQGNTKRMKPQAKRNVPLLAMK